MADADALKTKKDALVAALTQLSNAAQDASRACIDFYAAASISAPPPTFALPAPAPVASLPPLLPAANVTNAVPATPAVKPEPKKRAPKKAAADKPAEKANEGPSDLADGALVEKANGTEKEEDGKKRKYKRVIDPDAPRRPQTVYFAFANEARKTIREEFQERGIEASNHEIIKEVAERWKNMTESQKEPWKAVYAEQIKKYDVEKAAYNAEKGTESAQKKKRKDGESTPGPLSSPVKVPSTPTAQHSVQEPKETPGAANADTVTSPETTKPVKKRKKTATDVSGSVEESASTPKPKPAAAEPEKEKEHKDKEKRKKKKKSEVPAAAEAAGP